MLFIASDLRSKRRRKDRCPYAKFARTPCVVREGVCALVMDAAADDPVCVGCQRTPQQIGLGRPSVWEQRVHAYYRARAVRR